MNYANWIIGTLVIWVLHAVGTVPLARALSRGKTKEIVTASPQEVPDEPTPDIKGKKAEETIPTGIYILSDVIVMGVSGFLLGLLTKNYFIGFSLRAVDWPGMIVFIISSILGSSL